MAPRPASFVGVGVCYLPTTLQEQILDDLDDERSGYGGRGPILARY